MDEVIVYSLAGAELCRFVGMVDIDYIEDKIFIKDEHGATHIVAFPASAVVVIHPEHESPLIEDRKKDEQWN